jgi:hypothetical protein
VDKKTLGEGEGNGTDAVNTSSPSVWYVALGEELFPVSCFPGSSSPSVALGEGFPECFWLFPECLRHSGKQVLWSVSSLDRISQTTWWIAAKFRKKGRFPRDAIPKNLCPLTHQNQRNSKSRGWTPRARVHRENHKPTVIRSIWEVKIIHKEAQGTHPWSPQINQEKDALKIDERKSLKNSCENDMKIPKS